MTKNISYRRGRNKEYRLMAKLREGGFDIVSRSAGSHSAIDIFGIRKIDKKIIFVQSKPKKFSKKANTRLKEKFNWLNNKFICNFEIK